MKRIFSILIAVLLLAVLIPTAASAATVAQGTCGEKLTWTLDDAGTLTVSGTGSMPDFGFEEAPWFGHRASITQVILEPGVANISWNSFDYCNAMTRIQIPDTVTRIDSNFYYCTGLTEVYIPASVTYLSGFAQCSSLSRLEVDPGNPNYSSRNNVLFDKKQTLLITYPMGLTGTYVFPDTVTGISTSAFNSCKNLTGVVLSKGMKSVGFQAFSYCKNLASVTIPEGVETIEGRAFYECTALADLKLPESLTKIDSSAFSYCENLADLVIPKNVSVIESGAFDCCRSLSTIRFEGNAPTCSLSESDRAEEIFFAVTATAFYPANNPTWTEQMRESYGGNITWLSYETDNNSIIDSGDCGNDLTWTLDNTGKLTISGTGPMYIGYSPPWNSYRDQITAISIGDGVTTIGRGAFAYCTNLTGELVLPDSLTSIGPFAFHSSSGLTGDLIIPEGVTSIGDSAFYSCSGLTGDLVIPDSVTSIGNSAFSNCGGLTGDLIIPKGITKIESSTFFLCRSLSGKLVIPEGVTSIGSNAFVMCGGLIGNLVIPDSVTSIGSSAFQDCKGLTGDLVIPDSVTSIDSSAFYGCSGLTGSLVIPDSVTNIGYAVFYGCTGLTGKLVIPENVTGIEKYAFYNCRSIQELQFNAVSAPEIDTSAFNRMSALETVWVPAEALDAYTAALEGKLPDGVVIRAMEEPDLPTDPSGGLDWFFDRLKESDSYLWATATYQRIMNTLNS